MRITLDIPDGLYLELKVRAARKGTSVKELLLRGIQAEMKSGESPSNRGRIKLPIIRSKKTGTPETHQCEDCRNLILLGPRNFNLATFDRALANLSHPFAILLH